MKEKVPTKLDRQACSPSDVIYDPLGDGFCDDEYNIAECNFDGGDCCGPNVQTNWCDVCECKQPVTTQPVTTVVVTTPSQQGCQVPSWVEDGYCDDENNFADCDFDGGDCCGPNVNTFYCTACECKQSCQVPNWVEDGYCDDENNFADCGFDGGDCCGPNVNTFYCTACECKQICQAPHWVEDGFCDDENNFPSCGFDGGDCCGANVINTYCSDCFCLEP